MHARGACSHYARVRLGGVTWPEPDRDDGLRRRAPPPCIACTAFRLRTAALRDLPLAGTELVVVVTSRAGPGRERRAELADRISGCHACGRHGTGCSGGLRRHIA